MTLLVFQAQRKIWDLVEMKHLIVERFENFMEKKKLEEEEKH